MFGVMLLRQSCRLVAWAVHKGTSYSPSTRPWLRTLRQGDGATKQTKPLRTRSPRGHQNCRGEGDGTCQVITARGVIAYSRDAMYCR